jgi:2-hydroxy-6-oxo-octa-2,4-dienoate hydrolase
MVERGPEIGGSVLANGIRTNYLQEGEGEPVVLVHGSGPGVSAHANWRLTIPTLAQQFRVYALDMVGFGFTERPAQIDYNLQTWTDQLIGFLDALGIERASLVGNSFGGAIVLHAADQHPQRVNRLVLMGSVGVPFPITAGLDAVWGYEPSLESMSEIMDYFAYNKDLLTGDLAQVRFEASTAPGFHESYAAMFPAPRQRWVDALVTPDESIAALRHQTLVVHGREDRVIPLANAYRLLDLIPAAQLHVFGHCGHWTQIEKSAAFNDMVLRFLAGA